MPVDERTFVADVASWVTAILERRPDLPYSRARVEEHGTGTRKRHDFLLYRRGIERVALTGEIKMPDSPQGRSPFDAELINDAFEKASRTGVAHYFTWNVRDFLLWQTHREGVPWMERRAEGPTHVVDASVSEDVRRPEVEGEIKTFWEQFLERFAALEEGRRSLQNLPLDRRFILRLEHALEDPISLTWDELTLRYRRDAEFRSSLRDWMVRQQGWEVSEAPQPLRSALERAARLSCYVLVTRLVFYEVLRRRFRVLPALAGITAESPQELADILKVRFADAITHSHDYETIFEADDLGVTLPFIAAKAHQAWAALIQRIEEFDFSRLDFEVIGRMYEQLIGPGERRRYGQFYTSPEVVDLINAFCIRSADARVLDPGCGGGTFLVRAYTRKRAMATRQGQVPTHQRLLGELFGVDIAAFAAQLATINLAVRHLSDEPNYPQVARFNFFDVQSGIPVYRIPQGAAGQQEIPLAELDAVVGNPPYIRQEEIAKQEKDRLAKLFGSEWPGQGALSGRSDIYLHFFTHAAALLKPGGYLGLVTSIGWLDTEYGFHLQEWMLRNFRIVAVIESQVEKWFEDARVTTAVTILQREPDEAARRQNRVRFMYLRKPLAEIYTEALRGLVSEEDEVARQADMDAIRDLIEEIGSNQNTDYWRVRVLTQNELWNEGCRLRLGDDDFPSEAAEYKGGKWGQHIRGPDVYFDIRDRVGSRLVPLQGLAEVRFGFKTGVDKFFCVRDVTDQEVRALPDPAAFRAKWAISPEDTENVRIVKDGEGALHLVEARFLEPEFHSLMEAKSIVVGASDVGRRVINAPVSRAALRRTRLGDYVRYAEQRGWHTGSTVASRAIGRPWYDLGLRAKPDRAQMFWPKAQQYRHLVPWNHDQIPCKDRLYDVWTRQAVNAKLLWAVLNSSVVVLAKHQFGRPVGIEGNLDTEVVDVNMMLVPDVRLASAEVATRAVAAAECMARRTARRYLHEEFSLSDRQDLDDAVLEMLGFADPHERIQVRVRVYGAITELYQSTRKREEKAQKDRLRSTRKGQPTAADLADELWLKHQESFGLLQFPDNFLARKSDGTVFDLAPGHVEVGTAMIESPRRLVAGTIRVGGADGPVLEVGSVARSLFVAALAACGHSGDVSLPNDAECESAVSEFEKYRSELRGKFQALAIQRTRDERRQRAIVEGLIRRALHWRG